MKDLAADWAQSGISEGDTILLHSDLKRTLNRYMKQGKSISPQIVLDSFLDAVGPRGTLIIPTFNFDFTKGIPFNIRNTPSQMGVLTNTARLRQEEIRTGHPVYSFAIIGKHAAKFKDVNNYSGYGKDSPFAILRELNGKIAVLGLPDQISMTFYHHIEEVKNVPYRYRKEFTTPYIDSDENTKTLTYSIFVRNLTLWILTNVNPTGELMWNHGIYTGFRPDENSGLRVISARVMFEFISEIIMSGQAKGLLYSVEVETHYG